MKHVYCGELRPDTAGWDYLHSLERDQKYKGVLIGDTKFTKFCKVTQLLDPVKNLLGMKENEFVLYGDVPVELLFSNELITAPFFISLRILTLTKKTEQVLQHPLLKHIIAPRAIIEEIQKNKIRKTKRATLIKKEITYDPDLPGPMANSPEKGFLLIGANDAQLPELKTYLAAILHTKPARSIEFYIDKNSLSEAARLTLQAYLRASGALAAIIFVDLTNHDYYADIFSSSFMCIDLTKQYNYYRSCLQYRTVYYTDLQEANGNVFFKLWMYKYFKNKELHEQAVEFAQRT